MKRCEFCDKALTQRDNETPGTFARRKTCGIACYSRLITRRAEETEPSEAYKAEIEQRKAEMRAKLFT